MKGRRGLMALLWTCAAVLCGCVRDGGVPVPRPAAYPRIEMPAPVYRTLTAGETQLSVNQAAEATVMARGDALWIDVAYRVMSSPRLSLTLTRHPQDGISGVLRGRHERIALNLGGRPCDTRTWTNAAGWHVQLVTAPSATATPVQLLATDGQRVLSGALSMHWPDSLGNDPAIMAPVVKAVESDVKAMLDNLQ